MSTRNLTKENSKKTAETETAKSTGYHTYQATLENIDSLEEQARYAHDAYNLIREITENIDEASAEINNADPQCQGIRAIMALRDLSAENYKLDIASRILIQVMENVQKNADAIYSRVETDKKA